MCVGRGTYTRFQDKLTIACTSTKQLLRQKLTCAIFAIVAISVYMY